MTIHAPSGEHKEHTHALDSIILQTHYVSKQSKKHMYYCIYLMTIHTRTTHIPLSALRAARHYSYPQGYPGCILATPDDECATLGVPGGPYEVTTKLYCRTVATLGI